MPELGDVEGFRRVAQTLEGAEIRDVDVLDAGVLRGVSVDRLQVEVTGQRIGTSRRIGKWLIVHLGGPRLIFHFGMTGSLRRTDEQTETERFDRVVIGTNRGDLHFRDRRKLGSVALALHQGDVDDIVGRIGPDALSVSADDLRARLRSSRSAIKTALIDQSRVSGIGNYLSDEILWRALIHPATSTPQLTDDQWAALHRASSAVLHEVARVGHTPRGPRWLTGARWGDPPVCPRCATPLDDGVIGGRHAAWCPRCQPAT